MNSMLQDSHGAIYGPYGTEGRDVDLFNMKDLRLIGGMLMKDSRQEA